jgi:hypothetical protein
MPCMCPEICVKTSWFECGSGSGLGADLGFYMTRNFSLSLFCCRILDPRFEIRHPECKKIRIRDKHPGSATLLRTPHHMVRHVFGTSCLSHSRSIICSSRSHTIPVYERYFCSGSEEFCGSFDADLLRSGHANYSRPLLLQGMQSD